MAQRNRRRMMPSPLHPISAETAQLDNASCDDVHYAARMRVWVFTVRSVRRA